MSYSKRPTHTRQPSMLPPPTQSFLQLIQHTQTIPYTVLPGFSLKSKKEIVLLESPDQRYTFIYRGLMRAGEGAAADYAYTYQTFVVTDRWMDREWSVYVLDASSVPGSPEYDEREGSVSPPNFSNKSSSGGGAGGLKRSGSLSSSSTLSSGSSTIGGAGNSASTGGGGNPAVGGGGGKMMVGANEQFSLNNEKVRNALTAAFFETISRSRSSTQITI